MTIPQYINALLSLDPYEVVTAELDCFAAYECLTLPTSLQDEVEKMSEQDKMIADELDNEYLNALKDGGNVREALMDVYNYNIKKLATEATEKMITE